MGRAGGSVPLRHVLAALLMPIACGQAEQHSSHRSSYELSGDAVAAQSVAPNGVKGSSDTPDDVTDGVLPGSSDRLPNNDGAAENGSVDGDQTPSVPGSPKIPAPSAFSAGLYFGAPDTNGKLILQHDGTPVPGIDPLPIGGFSLTKTLVITFQTGATAYSSRLVVASSDGKMRRVIELPNTYMPQHPALSPDGTTVAYDARAVVNSVIASRSSIFAIDLSTSIPRVISQGGDAHAPVWFPITRRMLYVAARDDGGRDIVIIDPQDPSIFMTASAGATAHIAISPDESEIFVPASAKTLTTRLTPRATLGPAIAQGASASGLSNFSLLDAIYSAAGDKLFLAGTVAANGMTTAIIIAEVDQQGGSFKVLHGPLAITPQMVTNGLFLPLFLTDFL